MYIHEPTGITIHEPSDRVLGTIHILHRAAIISVHISTLNT
jgi:hypothetical protein